MSNFTTSCTIRNFVLDAPNFGEQIMAQKLRCISTFLKWWNLKMLHYWKDIIILNNTWGNSVSYLCTNSPSNQYITKWTLWSKMNHRIKFPWGITSFLSHRQNQTKVSNKYCIWYSELYWWKVVCNCHHWTAIVRQMLQTILSEYLQKQIYDKFVAAFFSLYNCVLRLHWIKVQILSFLD